MPKDEYKKLVFNTPDIKLAEVAEYFQVTKGRVLDREESLNIFLSILPRKDPSFKEGM